MASLQAAPGPGLEEGSVGRLGDKAVPRRRVRAGSQFRHSLELTRVPIPGGAVASPNGAFGITFGLC